MAAALFIYALWTLWASSLADSPTEESHYLSYLYTLTIDGHGQTNFLSVGILDGLQIDRYDSNSKKDIPTVDWMTQDSEFWEQETLARQEDQGFFSSMMKKHFNDSRGEVHTFQAKCECGFTEGKASWGEIYNSWGGIYNAHNGQDFLSFDSESKSWLGVAPPVDQPTALRLKRQWEQKEFWTKEVGRYVDTICLQRLRSFLQYRQRAQQIKKSPEVMVQVLSRKDQALCMATGYFPKGAILSWVREDNQELVPEHRLLREEEVPNGDGTFQIRLTLLLSPSEGHSYYSCRIQHSSMDEPKIKRLSLEASRIVGLKIGLPIGLSVALIIAMAIVLRRKCQTRQFSRPDMPPDSTEQSQGQLLSTRL